MREPYRGVRLTAAQIGPRIGPRGELPVASTLSCDSYAFLPMTERPRQPRPASLLQALAGRVLTAQAAPSATWAELRRNQHQPRRPRSLDLQHVLPSKRDPGDGYATGIE